MAIQTDDRVVVETPPARRRRLLFPGIIVTAVCAVAVIDRSDGEFGLIIGILGLLVAGPFTIARLVQVIRNQPTLVLDADGFTDHSTMISPGFVPWPEVQRIEERAFRRRVFVAITVTDREALRARQSAWHRLLLRINGPMAAGDILIPDNALPMSPAALVKTMRRLHRAAQRRTRS